MVKSLTIVNEFQGAFQHWKARTLPLSYTRVSNKISILQGNYNITLD